jgi:hypothetical protein
MTWLLRHTRPGDATERDLLQPLKIAAHQCNPGKAKLPPQMVCDELDGADPSANLDRQKGLSQWRQGSVLQAHRFSARGDAWAVTQLPRADPFGESHATLSASTPAGKQPQARQGNKLLVCVCELCISSAGAARAILMSELIAQWWAFSPLQCRRTRGLASIVYTKPASWFPMWLIKSTRPTQPLQCGSLTPTERARLLQVEPLGAIETSRSFLMPS